MTETTLYWRPRSAALAPPATQADPVYRALNPLGVVPTLVIGDEVPGESAAILLTLADPLSRARFAPDDRADS